MALIVVVDDFEPGNKLTAKILRGAGHDVVQFTNGFDALAYLETGGVDLMITDITMPHMDGFVLCQEVKSMWGDNCFPIIVMSARQSNRDRFAAYDVGASAYLTKPTSKRDLLFAVDSLLDEVELEHRW